MSVVTGNGTISHAKATTEDSFSVRVTTCKTQWEEFSAH